MRTAKLTRTLSVFNGAHKTYSVFIIHKADEGNIFDVNGSSSTEDMVDRDVADREDLFDFEICAICTNYSDFENHRKRCG